MTMRKCRKERSLKPIIEFTRVALRNAKKGSGCNHQAGDLCACFRTCNMHAEEENSKAKEGHRGGRNKTRDRKAFLAQEDDDNGLNKKHRQKRQRLQSMEMKHKKILALYEGTHDLNACPDFEITFHSNTFTSNPTSEMPLSTPSLSHPFRLFAQPNISNPTPRSPSFSPSSPSHQDYTSSDSNLFVFSGNSPNSQFVILSRSEENTSELQS